MDGVADRRRGIGVRLLEDEGALVDAFLATISREIPAYESLDDRQIDEVRSIIVWTLHRVLELWAEDGSLTAADIELFRGVGSVRARDGRPLSAVLRAYRVAAGVFLDQVTDLFRDEASLDDVTALVRVWFAVLDELSEAIYAGYESTGRFILEDRESSLRGLLTDLVLGRQSHAGTLTARLRELDAQLPTSFDLVVVRPTPEVDAEQAGALVTATVEAGAGTLISSIHTVMDGVGVVLLRVADRPILDNLLRENGLRAARHRQVTARSAPRAYRLAVNAVMNAPEFAWSAGTVLAEGDLEVLALVTGHADADPARVTDAVLGPVADDVEARKTLEALIRADGAAQASMLLHVHAQTVRYRLRRIAEVTGRDPRIPWNRYVFQTALMSAVT